MAAAEVARAAARRALKREKGLVLGWPKRSKFAHAVRWEYCYERLKLAQLLGQLGVFLTWIRSGPPAMAARTAASHRTRSPGAST